MKWLLCVFMLMMACACDRQPKEYLIEIKYKKREVVLHKENHAGMLITDVVSADTIKNDNFTHYCGECFTADDVKQIKKTCLKNKIKNLDTSNYDSRDELYNEFGIIEE